MPSVDPPCLERDALPTVSLAELHRLRETLDEHGFAVVPGVLSAQERAELQDVFWRDVASPLHAAPAASWPEVEGRRQCQGTKENGTPCTLCMGNTDRRLDTRGPALKHVRALAAGNRFCSLHLHQTDLVAAARAADARAAARPPGQAAAVKVDAAAMERGRLAAVFNGACLMSKRGLAHGHFSWRCRLHPAVQACFAAAHGTTDLRVSLDGALYTHGSPRHGRKMWPHVDYNPNDCNGPPAFQAMLYITDAQANTASTTVVLPRSHVAPVADLLSFPKTGKYVELAGMDEAQQLLATWKAGARKVPVPEGALLMWSEKLVHQGWAGQDERLVQPVCYEPAQKVSADAQAERRWMAALGVPSTHSASAPRFHQSYGKRPHLEDETPLEVNGKRYRVASSVRPVSLREDVTQEAAWGAYLHERERGAQRLLTAEALRVL